MARRHILAEEQSSRIGLLYWLCFLFLQALLQCWTLPRHGSLQGTTAFTPEGAECWNAHIPTDSHHQSGIEALNGRICMTSLQTELWAQVHVTKRFPACPGSEPTVEPLQEGLWMWQGMTKERVSARKAALAVWLREGLISLGPTFSKLLPT